jgi:hypothetical protein
MCAMLQVVKYIEKVPATDFPTHNNAARDGDTIDMDAIPYTKEGQRHTLFRAYVLSLDHARWLRAKVLQVLNSLYPGEFLFSEVNAAFNCGSSYALATCAERQSTAGRCGSAAAAHVNAVQGVLGWAR